MISKLTILHQGGCVLWPSTNDDPSSEGAATIAQGSNHQAINLLIQNILLLDKTSQDSMQHEQYTLKWTLENNFNLVFVAVYFSFQKLLYIDDFLITVKNEFINLFQDILNKGSLYLTTCNYPFDERYQKIVRYYTTEYQKQATIPKRYDQTTRGQAQLQFKHNKNGKYKQTSKSSVNDNNNNDDEETGDGSKPNPSSVTSTPTSITDDGFNKQKLAKNFSKPNVNNNNNNNARSGSNTPRKNTKKKKPDKKLRQWDFNTPSKISKANLSALNVSGVDIFSHENNNNTTIENENENENENVNKTVNLESSDEESSGNSNNNNDDEEEDFSTLLTPQRATSTSTEGANNKTSGGILSATSSIWNRLTKLVTDHPLTEEDLKPVLHELELLLTNKNVANSIAIELCSSVQRQLIGKQIGAFNTIRSTVKEAIKEALERLLTPLHSINILHGIELARKENRPYSIVFIGVNGVGKSTSLAKVIYYLKSRGLQVSVAACDTFRSGAIEQVKTHAYALKARLFEQGYARDPASVAAAAIKQAIIEKDDVILIDTAGRMQNNDKLMQQLVSLIEKNKPDLILFVGEALVGNDGIDQLMEFNRALQTYTNSKNPRLIDGIFLTKFDTVDDKVGAAISMTYKSQKPIIFIGTGQRYADLKRMHAKTLINKLLE